jgi:hypothetical protein
MICSTGLFHRGQGRLGKCVKLLRCGESTGCNSLRPIFAVTITFHAPSLFHFAAACVCEERG